MSRAGERIFVDGGAGRIETVLDRPDGEPRGVALVAHPHPLYGGTLDNKVVQTLAKTFVELGYISLRPNFRGVGASEGAHDEGRGETDDLLVVAEHAARALGELPLWLAGFSFGGGVAIRASTRAPFAHLVLMAPALRRITGHGLGTAPDPLDPSLGEVGRHTVANTIIVHGDKDDTVPLADSIAWGAPREVPVLVIPGADHFFHRKLHMIRDVIGRLVRPGA